MGGTKFTEASPRFSAGQTSIQKEESPSGHRSRWRVTMERRSGQDQTLFMTNEQLYDFADAADKALDWEEIREDSAGA